LADVLSVIGSITAISVDGFLMEARNYFAMKLIT